MCFVVYLYMMKRYIKRRYEITAHDRVLFTPVVGVVYVWRYMLPCVAAFLYYVGKCIRNTGNARISKENGQKSLLYYIITHVR